MRSSLHDVLPPQTRRALATMNAYFQENIAGMRVVQSFNREQRNLGQFSRFNVDYRQANIHTVFAYALFFPAMSFIASVTVAAVIWVGGRQLLIGRQLDRRLLERTVDYLDEPLWRIRLDGDVVLVHSLLLVVAGPAARSPEPPL